MTLLVNETGLELLTGHDADLDRELRVTGIANLIGSIFGGMVAHVSFARSSLNYGLGVRDRSVGIAVAIVALVTVVVGPWHLIDFVPVFAIAALLIALGGGERLPLADRTHARALDRRFDHRVGDRRDRRLARLHSRHRGRALRRLHHLRHPVRARRCGRTSLDRRPHAVDAAAFASGERGTRSVRRPHPHLPSARIHLLRHRRSALSRAARPARTRSRATRGSSSTSAA